MPRSATSASGSSIGGRTSSRESSSTRAVSLPITQPFPAVVPLTLPQGPGSPAGVHRRRAGDEPAGRGAHGHQPRHKGIRRRATRLVRPGLQQRVVRRGRPVPLLRELRLLHGVHPAASGGDPDHLPSRRHHGQLLAWPARQADLLSRSLPRKIPQEYGPGPAAGAGLGWQDLEVLGRVELPLPVGELEAVQRCD